MGPFFFIFLFFLFLCFLFVVVGCKKNYSSMPTNTKDLHIHRNAEFRLHLARKTIF
jgi:hypothetical protein